MTVSRRIWIMAVFTGLVVAVTFPVWRALVALALHDETASHVVLIPLVSAVLIVQDRRRAFGDVRWAPVAGSLVIAAGLAVVAAGRFGAIVAGRDLLSTVLAGAVITWLGGVLFMFGPATFRAELFPLLFLGFTIPFPEALIERATYFLKTGSAELVEGLFTLTRTPYYRDGFQFALPSFAIQIADECSGIRSSIALLLTALLAGHMFLRSGWKRALLVALVLPLALVKNAIRIVSLSLLAMYVNPSFLTGQLHHEGGIVFFLIALALVSPFFTLLRTSEPIL
jgi:exosortase